ncbi:MAG TPA: cysteine-rich CWC family protein [Rubrivivax sp.]
MAEAPDRCPRCGGAFHCGVADEQACPCGSVSLDAALQQRLRERFNGCLCITCLAAVARGSPLEPVFPAAR